MRPPLARLLSLGVVLLSGTLVACGGGSNDAPDAAPDARVAAPPFRNPVALADDELALAALQLLGADVDGASDRRAGCHGLTRQKIRTWRSLSDTSLVDCFTDLEISSPESAVATIDCFRTMPAVPTSSFTTRKLGVWATATHLPWFQTLFLRAYGDDAATELASFREGVGMPPTGTTALTQSEFDIVGEWFARGVPLLEETLPNDVLTGCTPGISAGVATHVTAMATTGWRQVNADASMPMYGCAGAADVFACMADQPRADTLGYADTWETGGAVMRVLKENNFSTSYWTRSSPDGRFVAFGVEQFAGSKVVDLMDDHEITITDAAYDPAFFPDNSGFVFQPTNNSNNTCAESVLLGSPASVTMAGNAACSNMSTVDLYEQVGRALGGGDYFAVDSQFVSDDGGHGVTLHDPDAAFDNQAYAYLTPMVFNGTRYQAKPGIDIETPYEGDYMISPSAKLLLSRVSGPSDQQLGYVLRRVDATVSGNSYDVTLPEIARYCVSGGKPGFSYDERWLVYHHYVGDADAVDLGFTGPADPAFDTYQSDGAANVYLLDLLTGETTRVSNMKAGQYALFPHFRSDGWIYFTVRDRVNDMEYTVATDAALRAEQP